MMMMMMIIMLLLMLIMREIRMVMISLGRRLRIG